VVHIHMVMYGMYKPTNPSSAFQHVKSKCQAMRLLFAAQRNSSFISFAIYYYSSSPTAAAPVFFSSAISIFFTSKLRHTSAFANNNNRHEHHYFSSRKLILHAKGLETCASNAVGKDIIATIKTTNYERNMSSTKAPKNKADENFALPHAPDSVITSDFDQSRSKLLTINTSLPREKNSVKNPCIFYWMMRDVRTVDNWALLFAQSLAVQNHVPLRVVYALPPPPSVNASEGQDGSPPAPAALPLTERHGTFLLDGLQIVAKELSSSHVPLDVLCPTSRDAVGQTICSHCTSSSHNALAVVCDMSPLREPRKYTEDQAAPLFEQSQVK
jgi:hypothetical protein